MVAPLFRATLIRLGSTESAFMFVVHHIIADSWSMEIIFRELAALYSGAAAAQRRGNAARVPRVSSVIPLPMR